MTGAGNPLHPSRPLHSGCEAKCWESPFVVSLSNHTAGVSKGLGKAQAERRDER